MANKKDNEKIEFERKMCELEDINNRLSCDISINEGIELFEKSLAITRDCIGYLNDAKGKITQIKKDFDKIINEF